MKLRLRRNWTRSLAASARTGAVFLAEVVVFWLIVEAVNESDYGMGATEPFLEWFAPVSLLMVALAMAVGERHFHLYRRAWSVASLNDAFAIGLAVLEASLLLTVENLVFPDGMRPLRVLAPVLAAPAVVIGIGLLRLLPRLRVAQRRTGNRLLVVIPDATGYASVKALLLHPNPDWTPIGIVTTGPAEAGMTIMGVPVLGRAVNLPRWIRVTDAQGIAFVHSRTADRMQMKSMYAESLAAQLPVFIIPGADQWFPNPRVSRLRQLSADDLVRREEREIDLAVASQEVRGCTVLVTGAAGSIGSELCRLLAAMQPKRLVLVDTNESGLFEIAEELRVGSPLDVREALVSIVDRDQLLALFADERPDVVFHAAAYKHVPMLEAHPTQAVMTNVIGTRNALVCAAAAGARRFILISTDKAASRHSVMGCTKRLCEELILAHRGQMSCWAVRFGNVVGSRGSVVPLFERQIEHGGPVTITHRDVSRYMMTIREAASLVLGTLSSAKASHLYMLDMGEPIRIYDLANDLIRSRGMRPDVDIKVVFTGLRPGERMTEELLAPDEGWRPTDHPSIREVVSPLLAGADDLAWTVERLERLAHESRGDEMVRALKSAVYARPEPVDEPRVARERKESA
jgi:FlaA1/EpsC-like NDP-sugar epimerase